MMKNQTALIRLAFILGLFIVGATACTFSLAEDIIPPPGSELSDEIVFSSEFEFPSSAIDLNSGAAIYAQSCAPCHGEGGLGDGPQAGELPFPPAPIGERAFALKKSFEEWFLQISNGDIEKLMPPFAKSYSVQDRWNVLAYVLSLGIQEISAELDLDFSLLPEDFRNLNTLASISGVELFDRIKTNLASQSEEFSDEVIWSMVDQVHSMALGLGSAGEVSASEPAIEFGDFPENIDVHGLVINSSGGGIPQEFEATMHIVQDGSENDTLILPVNSDGEFLVEDFPLQADELYFFSVDFQGLSYFSQFYSGELLADSDLLEIEIYESSQDVSKLEVELINMVFKFHIDGMVQVIEQVVISNNGKYAAAPGEGGDPLIQYQLPEGATELIFEQGVLGDRYIVEENGFGDIRAVLPGQNSYQIIFAYLLPYANSLDIEIPLQFATNDLVAFIPQGNTNIDQENFNYAGQQTVQSETFEAYDYSGELEQSKSVNISLSGAHPLETSAIKKLSGDNQFLIGLFALALSVAIGWLWYRSSEIKTETKSRKKSKEHLLDEIVALDQEGAEGKISKRNYAKQRKNLLDELRQKVRKNKK